MKHLLICVSVLAAVSISSAKSFKTMESGKRNPAQTGNVGPAGVKVEIPASAVCKFSVNGSGGPEQNIPLNITGSEPTGDFEVDTKADLGGGSGIQAKISIRQIDGAMYGSTLWLTDDVTGVQTLEQDFINFPAKTQSSSISAMLLFSKSTREITFGGKKLPFYNVQLICSLERKKSI